MPMQAGPYPRTRLINVIDNSTRRGGTNQVPRLVHGVFWGLLSASLHFCDSGVFFAEEIHQIEGEPAGLYALSTEDGAILGSATTGPKLKSAN
jgi:hypothetical protein